MAKSKPKGKRAPARNRAGELKGPRRPAGSGPAGPRTEEPVAAEGALSRLKPARRPRPTPTRRTPEPSGRYTPPVPRSEKVSPMWVPVLMFATLGLGMLLIILNYVNLLPGSEPSNTYLMLGLALIATGFVTATRYH